MSSVTSPRGRRTLRAILCGLALAVLASSASGQPAQGRDAASTAPWPGSPAWTSLAPYLPHLRDGGAATLPRPGSDVAVLALDAHVDVRGGAVDGDLQVLWPNTTDAPWPSLVLQLPGAMLGGRFTFTSATVDGAEVRRSLLADGRVLRLELPTPLAPGARALVRLRYRLAIPLGEGPSHATLGVRDGVLSLSGAVPLPAVHGPVGPADGAGGGLRIDGFDVDPPAPYGDLAFSASSYLRVRLTLPDDERLVAPVAVAPVDGRWSFAFGPARDLFLAAASDLVETTSTTDGGVRVSVWAGADRAAGARAVATAASAAIDAFEGHFVPYPYRRLTLVATPTDALGVEFPGIIALTGGLLGPAADPALVEGVVAHEVAHQWFYGLLGDDQISQPWIDESFAQLAALLYEGDAHGPRAAAGFRRSLEARWRRVGDADIPIGLPVGAYTPVSYGAIPYGRAPIELARLRDDAGPAAFDGALARLMQERAFGIVTSRDVVAALQGACGCDLGDWARDVLGDPAAASP